jgi:predicted acylesterase/phospholipase RssA
MIKNLVISGGGIRGFSALGLLQKLYENNLMTNITNYAGTSVGSAISFLLIIGYFPLDIFKILCDIDFKCFLENPLIDELFNSSHIGVYSQSRILLVIEKMAIIKNIPKNITFKELYDKFNKTLYITGSCLNTLSCTTFSHITHPNMSVITAISISSCIPFLFKPVNYENALWIDGGCLNNYPIDIFDSDLENTIGIYMNEEYKKIDVFDDAQQYIFRVIQCLLNNTCIVQPKYNDYTYFILNSVKIDWDLSIEEKKQYYNYGYSVELKK